MTTIDIAPCPYCGAPVDHAEYALCRNGTTGAASCLPCGFEQVSDLLDADELADWAPRYLAACQAAGREPIEWMPTQ